VPTDAEDVVVTITLDKAALEQVLGTGRDTNV